MEYSSSDPGLVVSAGIDTAADANGYFSSIPQIVRPGRYTVTATGRLNWRLPVVHAQNASEETPVEVFTDGNGGLLGARLDWHEIPDDGVSVEYTIWGVEARVIDPLPVVVLHHGWIHEGNTEFHYTIDPPSYPALATDMVFSEDGHDVLVASALGSGTGTMTLGPGEFFTDPAVPHTVRMRLNHGWGWWMGSSLVGMGMEYGGQPFTVVGMGIRSAFKMPVDETEMKRMIEPVTGTVSSRTLGGIRIKLWTDEDNAVVTDGYQWNASEGRFFEDQYSETELTDADDRRLRTIWWEPPPNANQDWVVSLSVTVNRIDGGTEILHDRTTFKSRVLEVQTPIMEGDDVAMLQSALRMLGFSTEENIVGRWGIGGDPPVVDKKFGPKSRTAVHAFQVADEVRKTSKVDDATLKALEENWTDYVGAYRFFPNSPRITVRDSRMDQWITEGVTPTSSEKLLLKFSYSDALHQQVPPEVPYSSVPYNDLIREWIIEEAGLYGQWGRAIPFRVTLGAADQWGSIGFSQIQARYRYSGAGISDLKSINLYDPVGAIKGMGVFSNVHHAPAGGGFYKAFVGGSFKKEIPISRFPHVEGNSKYEDTVKDLLTKALGSYNGGTSPDVFDTYAWPQSLQKEPIPGGKRCDTYKKFDFHHAMCYALQIEKRAHVALSCWIWVDEAITAGADSICDSVTALDPRDVDVSSSAGIGNPTSEQVCIVASSGNSLYSNPQGDDVLRQFSFEYCEADWMNGISWEYVRSQEIAQGVHFVP